MCFYFNVMPRGCCRPADKCSFAHVYLDGALEARRRAEAQGILPPVTSTSDDGDGEGRHHAARAIAAHDPSPLPPPPPPPQQQQQQLAQPPLQVVNGVPLQLHPVQQLMHPPPHSTGGRVPGYPPLPASVAPSWHQPYSAPPPIDVGAAAATTGGDEILYDNGPTKVYIQMPRSRRTGQRVCYYHNVGKCCTRDCPFLHILVRSAICVGGASIVGPNLGEMHVCKDVCVTKNCRTDYTSVTHHRWTCGRCGPRPSSSHAPASTAAGTLPVGASGPIL